MSLRTIAKRAAALAAAGAASCCLCAVAQAQVTLLNVSYDVTRELYKDIDSAFVVSYRAQTGETVTVRQSHGGSSPQALAVTQGLQADVVTMNQSSDIDLLHQRGDLVPADWRTRLPYGSSPYTTSMVFLVHKGNPKHITDWGDLIKPGVAVIIPNPKTSGNGRYSYLAAWGWRVQHGGTPAQAQDFVTHLFHNVPVLDSGGRGATTSFTQRGLGDVLVTFENEAALITGEAGANQYEVVYPSVSVLAEPPVAVVDKVVDKHGTRKEAQAYLQFLFSPAGQEIIAEHHLRPRDATVLRRHAAEFPPLKTFTVDQMFGGWDNAQKTHFADDGIFDQVIMAAKSGAQ